jgi:phage gpG-like protein
VFSFRIIVPTATVNRISQLGNTFHTQLEDAVDKAIKDAERISKQEFLSGPRPDKLDVRTGTLRRSVKGTMESGNPIRGILSAGPLPYAAIHEFGGKTGRGHRVTMRARPYLRPALKAVLPYLKNKISQIFAGLHT